MTLRNTNVTPEDSWGDAEVDVVDRVDANRRESDVVIQQLRTSLRDSNEIDAIMRDIPAVQDFLRYERGNGGY